MKQTLKQALFYMLMPALIASLSLPASAQSVFLPVGSDWHFFIQRLEVQAGKNAPYLHTAFQPFSRQAIVNYASQLDSSLHRLSHNDRQLIYWLNQQHPEWSVQRPDSAERGPARWFAQKKLLSHVYAFPADAFRYKSDGFFVSINPVLNLHTGWDNNLEQPLFNNTRGVEMRGMISGRIGFYSFLAENQARLPQYVDAHRRAFYSGSMPGDGWAKGFKEGGVDYFTARGYVTMQATEHISLQFGQDKLGIGSGIRSLLLSDFANNYLFLRIQTRYRFFQYQNTWARLTDYPLCTVGRAYDAKYSITHHLSVNLGERFQLGLFENVVSGRSDVNLQRKLDAHYLNPIIFYRAIEHHVGDPDKVAIGADWRWLATQGLAFYGQVYLDEFRINDIRNDLDSLMVRWGLRNERKREGFASFANKFALQLGTRLSDPLGIENLDIQAEINLVRPYVYTHYDVTQTGLRPGASYTHYSQPMAHPLGANFREWAAKIHYRPHYRLSLSAQLLHYVQGRDQNNLNYGGNILKDYRENRPHENSAYFLDGLRTRVGLAELAAGYQFIPGWHLEARYLHRRETAGSTATLTTNMFTLGLRVNASASCFFF